MFKKRKIDILKRKNYKKVEQRLYLLKSLANNEYISKEFRYLCDLKVRKSNKYESKIRPMCVLTGRTRGIFSRYRLSRIAFRELASKGLFDGVKKGSW